MEYLHIELTICDSLSNCMFVLSFLESITFLKVAQIVPLDCSSFRIAVKSYISPTQNYPPHNRASSLLSCPRWLNQISILLPSNSALKDWIPLSYALLSSFQGNVVPMLLQTEWRPWQRKHGQFLDIYVWQVMLSHILSGRHSCNDTLMRLRFKSNNHHWWTGSKTSGC